MEGAAGRTRLGYGQRRLAAEIDERFVRADVCELNFTYKRCDSVTVELVSNGEQLLFC